MLLLKFLLIPFISLSINGDTTFISKNLPVKNGFKIFTEPTADTYGDISTSLEIYSLTNEVYNVEKGVVKRVFVKDGVYTIVIRSKNKFFTYKNLKSVNVKQNSVLKSSEIIGTLYSEDEGVFSLIFKITTSKKDYYDFEIVDYLRKNSF